MAQAGPSFPARNVYPSSSKLPDRTAVKTGGPGTQGYSQSGLGRRPDQSYQFGQSSTVPQQQQQQQQQQQRSSIEKESNVLGELSEEQRDEINEAVCWQSVSCRILPERLTRLSPVRSVRPRPRPTPRLPRITSRVTIPRVFSAKSADSPNNADQRCAQTTVQTRTSRPGAAKLSFQSASDIAKRVSACGRTKSP